MNESAPKFTVIRFRDYAVADHCGNHYFVTGIKKGCFRFLNGVICAVSFHYPRGYHGDLAFLALHVMKHVVTVALNYVTLLSEVVDLADQLIADNDLAAKSARFPDHQVIRF